MTRTAIMLLAVVAAGCSSPAFNVAASADDAGASDTASSDTAPDGGDETTADSGSDSDTADETSADAPDDASANADAAPPGVGLPCTNMAECAPYGLLCISQFDPSCAGAGTYCPRRYTCQTHPSWDDCGSPPVGGACGDIHCVSAADCPPGAGHCIGLADTAPDDTCRVTGFFFSFCSAGGPAKDPTFACHSTIGTWGGTDTLYTCSADADCIMDDGTTATCCRTSVGISYCASECTLQ